VAEVKRSFKASSTYPGRIVVIFTDDIAATSKRLDPEDQHPETLAAFCFLDDTKPAKPGRPVMVVSMDASMGDIVHEADHVAFDLLKFWGVPVTYEDNEAHAYLLESIVDKVIKLQAKVNERIFEERLKELDNLHDE
jgi:hypothetical protein